ncbi:hypothetical protein L208DRAFT_1292918 [Tricholoma matsutake]|nr:hypothetical protein L208DRAFT_1292918 [Tricholoma matsutake 945]
MALYLKNGELNSAIEPTQKGFLHLFSAWILDESLPWTTGEAPSLHILFKYLKIKFILLSDTTVCNQLAKIFAELHAKVVRTFTVSWCTQKLVAASEQDIIECQVKNTICNRYLDDKADGLHICLHSRLIHQ